MSKFFIPPGAEAYHRARVERLRSTADLPPPWVTYPEIPYGSIHWRMGSGEDVMMDWWLWIGALTAEQRAEYAGRHPSPSEWAEFFQRALAGQSRDVAQGWDAYWDAEIEGLS